MNLNKEIEPEKVAGYIKAKSSYLYYLPLLAIVWLFASGFYSTPEKAQTLVFRNGQLITVSKPGLNYALPVIDETYQVDLATINSFDVGGLMLTADENMIQAEFNIQYRRTDAKQSFMTFVEEKPSIQIIAESIIRSVVADTTMEQALTVGRERLRYIAKDELSKMVLATNAGVEIVDVNYSLGQAPEEVKAAFDDVVQAREDAERYVKEAQLYSNDITPKAEALAARQVKEAEAYGEAQINKAQGDVAGFLELLPKYRAAPEITKSRLYYDTIADVYKHNQVVISDKSSGTQLNHLDLTQLINKEAK